MSRRFSVLVLLVVACLIAITFTLRNRPPGRPSVQRAPIASDPAEHTNPGYVGWEACAECHARRVDEFRETRHFQALRLPDQWNPPEGFRNGNNTFTPSDSPVQFQMSMSQKGGLLTATSTKSGNGERTASPVEFIYGAGGGTDEVYFTRRGNKLFELPVAWLHPQRSWGASRFDPFGSGDFSRPLTPQCLECHTTWVDYHRGTLNEYGPLQSQLIGVTCERCHGPAKTHVEHHRKNRQEKAPVSIVQPARLSRERQMDLCAQCHTNAVRHRRPPFSYRPGEVLDESYRVLEMQHPEQDRVANQVRYLKESRCYQHSESLTCITCHDPHHKRAPNQMLSGQRMCATCHQLDACLARPRLPDDVKNQCVDCHMPRRNKIQVAFVTSHHELAFPAPRYEHRIAVYPEAELEVLFSWHGTQSGDDSARERKRLADQLGEQSKSVAIKAANEQRFVLAIDAYRQALRFIDSTDLHAGLDNATSLERQSGTLWFRGVSLKRERRLQEAVAEFESLLKIEPNLARAHLELGICQAALGRKQEGVAHLEIAARNDPNDPGPFAMLGWLELLEGRVESAEVHYRQAAEIEPWSDMLQYRLGQCLIALGKSSDAIRAFQRAIEINPNHAESHRELQRLLK